MQNENKTKLYAALYTALFAAALALLLGYMLDFQAISSTFAIYGNVFARNSSGFTAFFYYSVASFAITVAAVISGAVAFKVRHNARKADALKTLAWFLLAAASAAFGISFLLAPFDGDADAVCFVFNIPAFVSCSVTAILSATHVNKNRKHVFRAAAATVALAALFSFAALLFRSVDEKIYRYENGTVYACCGFIAPVVLCCGEALSRISGDGESDEKRRAAVAGVFLMLFLLAAQVFALNLKFYEIQIIQDNESRSVYYSVFSSVTVFNLLWLFAVIPPFFGVFGLACRITEKCGSRNYSPVLCLKSAAVVLCVCAAIGVLIAQLNSYQLSLLNSGWNYTADSDPSLRPLALLSRYYNRYAYQDSLIGMRNTLLMQLIPLCQLLAAILGLVFSRRKPAAANSAACSGENRNCGGGISFAEHNTRGGNNSAADSNSAERSDIL